LTLPERDRKDQRVPALTWIRRAKPIVIVTAVGILAGVWHYTTRFPSIPDRPLRIGFEQNPPVQMRSPSGFSGLAVEAVSEAARRARLPLQWVETGASSDESFSKGMVDLWPLMADLPDRRKRIHITKPWLHSSHVLLLRSEGQSPTRDFTGRIALFKMPLHTRLLRQEFPKAELVEITQSTKVVGAVCTGDAEAAFLEGRVAVTALRDKPPECASISLHVQTLPATTIQLGIASTFQAAAAAERLRDEIGRMFRDGTLAVTMAKYSYYGLEDTWSTYDLIEATERARWMAIAIGALAVALAIALWQAHSLRRARKATERANIDASQTLARYRLVARAANDVLFEWDLKTGAVVWNEAVQALFGYQSVEVGSDIAWWDERIHPDDRVRVTAGIQRALTQGAPTWSDEYRFLRRDGLYAFVVDRGHIVYEDGAPARFVRAIMDVSALRKLEEDLRQAQKLEAVGRLAGGVAHDFNNLLTVILGYGALLKATVRGKQNEQLDVILDSAGKAAQLTRQLLACSRRQILRPDILDLNIVIGAMDKILGSLVPENVELVFRLAPDLGCVYADRGQIEQVVMNLCVNARDAMPQGGKLTIETANTDDGLRVMFAVHDTGRGIDPADQAHIFEPFFTTKEVGKGTGLGLSTCLGIVEQSGGHMSVESEPGKGTSFKVWLPRHKGALATPKQESLARANLSCGSETILLAEDEEDVRKLAELILRNNGYTVLSASDGVEALRLAHEYFSTIDLLLTDVIMRRIGGYELAEELTKLRPTVKVLFMSGYPDQTTPTPKLERDRAFLFKPFTAGVLLEKVRETLYGSKRASV
jgi:PAS domain S-box-containing protein